MLKTNTVESSIQSPAYRAYVYDIDGAPLDVAELAARAHNSEFGVYMDQQPLRFWDNFGYDRDTMLADLGPDMHPIGHQNETARHMALALDAEHELGLTDEELGILMFACRIHDMGESMHPEIAGRVGSVVGDIPAGQKTDEDRLIEKKVREFIYAELYSDVDPEILLRVEALIAHEDDTLLHELYELAHGLQTFDTALQAMETWQEGVFHHHGSVMDIQGPDGGRTSAVLGLHRSVFSRTGVDLYTNYFEYKQVQKVLAPHLDELERYTSYNQQIAA